MRRTGAGFQGFLQLVIILVPAWARADSFSEDIQPFLKTYCIDCHNAQTAEAQLNLTRESAAKTFARDFQQWETVITFLERREMPPAEARQPTDAERSGAVHNLRSLLASEARKNAGDPGVVASRRLSNAEYNNSIRDLTGFDLHPAEAFPVDPAAGEGFSNTGEALSMSPALFRKYYAAAQSIADHIDFTPSGWRFAPYPVATYADQKKFHEQALLDFYSRHDVSYERYLEAALEFRGSRTRLEAFARERGLSPRYFQAFHDLISGPVDGSEFYVRWIRNRWSRIESDSANPAAAQAALRVLAADLRRLGTLLCPVETEAIVSNAGNGPIEHLDRRRKTAAERDTFREAWIRPTQRVRLDLHNVRATERVHIALHAPRELATSGLVLLDELNFTTTPDRYKPADNANVSLGEILRTQLPEVHAKLAFGQHPHGATIPPTACVLPVGTTLEFDIPTQMLPTGANVTLFVDAALDRPHSPEGIAAFALLSRAPTGDRIDEFPFPLVDPDHPVAARLRASCSALCQVLPNRFVAIDETRGLSAGFHLIEGFFRDDQPLCRRVLSDEENHELDRLWDELMFGTRIAEKMLRGFVFFERSERNFMKHRDFDSFKEEDPSLVTLESVSRLEEAYFRRSHGTGARSPDHPIHRFFADIRTGLQRREEQLKIAEPQYLKNLEVFAERAFRRSLTPAERQQMADFYARLASRADTGIEGAIRASVVRLLVSPHFCFLTRPPVTGPERVPLTNTALATRLSYFLWASTPDDTLLQIARNGRLQDEDELRQQVRRMLQDERVSGFAREFFGQWLRYRDFLSQEAVSRETFPQFDDALRQAMFEEPTRWTTRLIQQNRSVTELLTGDATVVNRRLARHYGLTPPTGDQDWTEVSGLHTAGRGGLLGMAVFLTGNSQPQRTSPVKRGFWVVHHLLGEHIPAPPPDVVALPAKETDVDLTVRQLLAAHVSDAKCARCHQRFDSVGLSMEGFDAIGRRRDRDLAGRPVDTAVDLPDGQRLTGIPEYSRYLATTRAEDFRKTLCRKFLGFALGRSLLLSDQPLLDEMEQRLQQNEFRFGVLFETVVLSPQFRMQRGEVTADPPTLSQIPGE